MLALDERLFPTVHDRLFAQLSKFRTTVRLATDPRRRSTAVVTARGVRSASSRLKKRLHRVFGYSSEAQIHRARIAAKHLRYLMEPFAKGLSNEDTVIEQLKSLQSACGDVHDAHVFMAELREALLEAETTLSDARDVVPGLTALIKTLHARGKQAFETVSTSWLWDRSEPFFNQVDAVADTIADLAQADREVERKFLLTGLPPLEDAEGSVEIEQGYLPGERLIERLRRIESPDTVELVRTVKEGSGLTRLEVEEPVTRGVFDQFWPLTEGRRLRKRRYRIPEGDLVWEIDEFLDRDLVLAEVELPGPTSEIAIPGWLRPHVTSRGHGRSRLYQRSARVGSHRPLRSADESPEGRRIRAGRADRGRPGPLRLGLVCGGEEAGAQLQRPHRRLPHSLSIAASRTPRPPPSSGASTWSRRATDAASATGGTSAAA